MTGLVIVGAGGHGRVVADSAKELGSWDRVAFLDDDDELARSMAGYPVLGAVACAVSYQAAYADLIVAIGDNTRRIAILREHAKLGFRLPSIVHPRAWVSSSVVIEEGAVVFALAAVNCDATIGFGAIVNTGATVDHDCALADGVHVCPGAHLAGGVSVGARSWIGTGACVVPSVRIGADAVIGAGAAVIDDVPSRCTVVGVPAKPLRKSA
jgi:sugar O-acyltransferase (sialic acid O-acetyltransferase NeuD family)